MASFVAPLVMALTGHLPVDPVFAAIAAQGIALVDVRGAYALRLSLLLAMSCILAAAAALGTVAAHPLAAALAATALVGGAAGLWRHLSSDYGPSLAATSSLVFFIALVVPGGPSAPVHHALGTLLGGAWGVALQVAFWPLKPQHPLRQVVGEGWLAAADLFAALSPQAGPASPSARQQAIGEKESALQAALDRASAALAGAPASRFARRLQDLNAASSRLALRVSAFATALESADPDLRLELESALVPIFAALGNLSRTVALAAVSRQPGHLATAEVRIRRTSKLLSGVRSRLSAAEHRAPWAEAVADVEDYLPTVGAALRATIGRADERAAFSLELVDLQGLAIRPLAASLNLQSRIDPALVRFTARTALLTAIGVALIRLHPFPHGYWLPFTMVVVLQPEYGATRQRAASRLVGTLVGSIVASLLLGLHPGKPVLLAAAAATSFTFGYLIKRHYGAAVVFITLFVVLLTEANGPANLALTAERMGLTLAGGLLAMVSALIFWPVWERDRFPPVLAGALRANRDYLDLIVERLGAGGRYDMQMTRARRAVERANSRTFSSLQRLFADPKNRQEGVEETAALANTNQRLTRILNTLVLRLEPGSPVGHPALQAFGEVAKTALSALADSIERPQPGPAALEAARGKLASFRLPLAETAPVPRDQWIFGQLARAATELNAMLLMTS